MQYVSSDVSVACRFSDEEKQTLRQAAEDFAQEHDLPTDDWSWLYHTCKQEHAGRSKGAWQAIASALPHRKYKAVYSAGTRMLHEANYQVTCRSSPHAVRRVLVRQAHAPAVAALRALSG